MFTSLHRIAERRIQEAVDNGELDLPHWKNRPLPPDDMARVPEDLRLAYRMLKNAGYLPEEVLLRKEIRHIEELLEGCTDEQLRLRQMRKLNCLRGKLEARMGRPLRLDAEGPYYARVVERITVRGRKGGRDQG